MSHVNSCADEKWCRDNGYKAYNCFSKSFSRIGNSKYLWTTYYLIKDFDKYFKIEDNPFDNNFNKTLYNSVSFSFSAIGDKLILRYRIRGNNVCSEFKKFEIENCARIVCRNDFYKKEYLDKAKTQLNDFIINFLNNNCLGIDKESVNEQLNDFNKEKRNIDIKISRLEQSLKETY